MKLYMGESVLRQAPVFFKGGTKQTTTRNIPAQSGTEAALQGGLFNYANSGLQNATNLQNKANSALDNTVNVDYNQLLNNYNSTMSGVNSGYANLTSGQLPTEFATARQNALSTDLNSTVGSIVNRLGNNGVLNSSVTRGALNDVSANAANSLNKSYASDLSTYSGLLGNQATNAANVMSNTAQNQQNSYYEPSQLYNIANNLYSPASNLFNTMYSGRMGTGGTTTTTSGGKGGLGGALGSVVGIGLGNSSFGKNW